MSAPAANSPARTPWWRRAWFRWTAILSALTAIILTITLRHVARNVQPDLRKRIIETLSARFAAPVDLDRVEISAMHGIEVTGYGLRIYDRHANPASPSVANTLLYAQRFNFRTDIATLRHSDAKLGIIHVDGLEIHVPPSAERGPLLRNDTSPTNPQRPPVQPRATLAITHVIVHNAKLLIETDRPGKLPLDFDIAQLELTGIQPHQPFRYDAQLTNPKPTGLIHATGSFGPWQPDEPRATPIDGNYTFDHADLNSITGLGGILSSTGHFSGKLQSITVDGETNTPDFSLDVSEHPVPLRTQFHAIVDGTSGDTFLDPVHATMLHSEFTARGKIVKTSSRAHDIRLTVDMDRARIEDMLRLAVKTSPPIMRGALAMHTLLHIPPGEQRVSQKLQLNGRFAIHNVAFSNPATQDKIDSLSMRAQGRPKEAQAAGSDRTAQVRSELQATFDLHNAIATVTNLHYDIPGANVALNGVYSLDGQIFEFKGHLRTDASASHMTTGWKSILLKPVDPFFKKNGAGADIPIQISGTKAAPHFGLALHGSANQTPAEMAREMKLKAQEDAAIRAQARRAPPPN